jgi:hypothetical protein
MFEICAISITTDQPEQKSESDESEEAFFETPSEIYSRFIEAKQIFHSNLASYISLEQLTPNKAIIISESHAYSLENLLSSRM